MGYTLRQLHGYSAACVRIEAERQLERAIAARAAGQDAKAWREWVRATEKACG